MKHKLRLGIDIDGTVTCPTTFVPYLKKDFDKTLTYQDITEYNLANVLNCEEAEIHQWFKDNEHRIYKDSPVANGAKETLNQLKEDYELYYISARHDYLDDITKYWFKQHDVPFDQITLTGSHNKLKIAKEQNIDIFIEDKLDNAEDIHEALGIPVILFDTPYNQKTLPEHIHRVYNWNEVLEIIRQYQ